MSDRVEIMSHGVLQQVGMPQEIYTYPANGFVASFVGENNMFPGRVIAGATVAAESRRRSGTSPPGSGPGSAQGAMAKLYVRPEHSVLATAPVAEA